MVYNQPLRHKRSTCKTLPDGTLNCYAPIITYNNCLKTNNIILCMSFDETMENNTKFHIQAKESSIDIEYDTCRWNYEMGYITCFDRTGINNTFDTFDIDLIQVN